jgi:hypothetical protein
MGEIDEEETFVEIGEKETLDLETQEDVIKYAEIKRYFLS